MASAYQQFKNIYHLFQAHLWRALYGFPDKDITLFGVTGTNGKTTTCYVLAGILSAEFGEEKVGMLTTVGLRIGKDTTMNATKLTTLPSRLVYSYLKRMKDAGVTHCVLEMTSHALDQHRVAGIELSGAIILNISAEHVSYHGTVENIAAAKAKILTYVKPDAPVVGKKDDEHVASILQKASDADIPVISFTSAQASSVTTPLAGEANKENVQAASLLAGQVGISVSAIEAGVAGVVHVPGRMEWVKEGQPFDILIDYAVTPDALEKLYAYVRRKTTGKVYAILGAAGLRDRGKRAKMAKVVSAFADELVITREDPWTEDEEQIFQDLEKELPVNSTSWQRIVDRKEAIAYVVRQAQPGDTVVITGKGAETGMGIGKKVVPYSEREAIKEALAKL